MPDVQISRIADRLQEWLIEESDNWKFMKLSDPALLLSLQIKSLTGRNIHLQIDQIHDRVFLLSKMSPNPLQKRAFMLLPAIEKKKFSAQLLVMLFQMGISAGRNPEGIIEYVDLQTFIYFDGLTKHKFFESLYMIWRGIESIQAVYDALPDIPSNDHTLQ